jgi:hypothetical protein
MGGGRNDRNRRVAGLSLLDNHPSPNGAGADPLPFQHASMSTAWRLPPDRDWRSRLEATGSLPARPAGILVDRLDEEVDEMDQSHGTDELSEGPLAAVYDADGLLPP